MSRNPYAPPQEQSSVERLPSQPPSRASWIGFFLSLPCPIVFGVVIGIDLLQKSLNVGGIAGWALDRMGTVLAAILWILLGFIPVNAITTLFGVGQSPRSKLAWIALFFAVLPLLIYFTSAYFHHLSQQ